MTLIQVGDSIHSEKGMYKAHITTSGQRKLQGWREVGGRGERPRTQHSQVAEQEMTKEGGRKSWSSKRRREGVEYEGQCTQGSQRTGKDLSKC